MKKWQYKPFRRYMLELKIYSNFLIWERILLKGLAFERITNMWFVGITLYCIRLEKIIWRFTGWWIGIRILRRYLDEFEIVRQSLYTRDIYCGTLPTWEVIKYKFSQAKAGGSLPYLKKRGGGADGYIRSIKPAIFRRLVPYCTACLHR